MAAVTAGCRCLCRLRNHKRVAFQGIIAFLLVASKLIHGSALARRCFWSLALPTLELHPRPHAYKSPVRQMKGVVVKSGSLAKQSYVSSDSECDVRYLIVPSDLPTQTVEAV